MKNISPMKKLGLILSATTIACAALAETNTFAVRLDPAGKVISPALFGAFPRLVYP